MEYKMINLFSKELNREKQVYIYLPKNYSNTSKSYPVLYMHDGQNLFDDQTAYMNRSWRIIDLYRQNPDMIELIIVGINSDDVARADELIPYQFNYKEDIIWGGEARKYLDFIVKTVKPMIDSKYRTLKDASNTGLMGSSFGGVNTLFASVAYSDYFTRFGCLSNALMYGFYPKLKQDLLDKEYHSIKKLYMDVGDSETNQDEWNNIYVTYNDEVYDILKGKIEPDKLTYQVIKNGIHHESSWELRFKEIVQYLFESCD